MSLLSYEIFNFSRDTPAWSCPIAWAFRRFDKRRIFTSYKRPLSKLQLYLTQTLFKANFIFQTKGDNIIHVFGLHQWPPEHHSKTFHPLKKITLHHWHSCKTCTVTWALFKTHCIFKRNGDFGVENNAFCNISLLTLPYIQEYCTFHDYIITADGTSL